MLTDLFTDISQAVRRGTTRWHEAIMKLSPRCATADVRLRRELSAEVEGLVPVCREPFGSCQRCRQVPTETGYRTHVRVGIRNATDCDRTGRRAKRRTEQIVVTKVSLGGQQMGSIRPL